MSDGEAPSHFAAPRMWKYSARAWRANRHLTPRRLDYLLQRRSAARLPISRARFRAMGLPENAIDDALRQVRALQDWEPAWTWLAQRLLGEARRRESAGSLVDGALARRHAALAYHIACFFAYDSRTIRALRASATALFAQSLPALMPDVRRCDVPWRATALPAYVRRPERVAQPVPLVVILNGSTTAKEETLLWSGAFVDRGIAVLALDWPGTGEAGQSLGLMADCDDLTDGILAIARDDPELDESRVTLLGFSLGGAVAVRAAAFDRRIAGVVAVTPPYNAKDWLHLASPVLVEYLTVAAGRDLAGLGALASDFSLVGIAERLKCPLLVIGAGRDLIVPPAEALRLAATAGELGTLLWFPETGHGLYEALDDWTDDTARWLIAFFNGGREPQESTPVESTTHAETTSPSTVAVTASERDDQPTPSEQK